MANYRPTVFLKLIKLIIKLTVFYDTYEGLFKFAVVAVCLTLGPLQFCVNVLPLSQ